jgi:hypothetical protein
MASNLILFKPDINPDIFFRDSRKWTLGPGWSLGPTGAIHTSTSSFDFLELNDAQVKPFKTYKYKIRVENNLNPCLLIIGGQAVEFFVDDVLPNIYSGTVTLTTFTDVSLFTSLNNTCQISYLNIVEDPEQYQIDLTEDIDVPLTFSIAEIQDPAKRNAAFSKTVTIPGTKQNNLYFNHIFEIGLDGTFNPNKKAKMAVITDGLLQLQGVVKLSKINRINNGINNYDLISYEIILFGNLADLFYELGDKMLTDLDFSEYDHVYSRENQRSSWYSGIIKDGVPYANTVDGPFRTITSCQYAGGRVQMNFSGNHSLVVGDWILIPLNSINNINYLSENFANFYMGEHMVYSVPSATSVVLQCPFQAAVGNTFSTKSFGTDRVRKHTKKGEGYVYPLIDYDQTDSETWDVSNLFPALYVKDIIDKIFSMAKSVYSSTDFDSVMFKKLIVPNTLGAMLSEDSINARSFRASLTSDTFNTFDIQPFYIGGLYHLHRQMIGLAPPDIHIPFDNDSTFPNFDNQNVYNTTTFRFDCPASGVYTLKVFGNLHFGWEKSGPTASVIASANFDNIPGVLRVEIFDYTTGVTLPTTAVDIMTTPLNTALPDNTDLLAILPLNLNVDELSLVAGRSYGVRLKHQISPQYAFSLGGVAYTGDITLKYGVYAGCSFMNQVLNPIIREGDLFPMNGVLPKMKCTEFLTNIIKMFNLYLDVDKSNEKKLFIETRNDFYNNNVIDWTKKLDTNSQINISPMGALNAKVYAYNYKEDKDFYNQNHISTYDFIYGNRKYQIDNDFVKETYNTDITFSPTILTAKGFGGEISNMQKDTNNTDKTKVVPFAGNMRILYFNCASSFFSRWTHTSGGVINNNTADAHLNRSQFYPYAGHLDKPLAPFHDLNWDFPRGVYFAYDAWTDRNLYNLHYKRMIEEITEKNSKIITCKLHLTAKDINTLDFRNMFLIDGHFLRLNKISDFSVGRNVPVTCEFLKISDKPNFVSVSTGVTGDGRAVGQGGFTDKRFIVNESDNPEIMDGHRSVTVQGLGNSIGSHGTYKIFVSGDNNIVSNDTRNIMIHGDNNFIKSGLRNVTILNTSNLIVTESNVSYINGVKVRYTGAILNDNVNIVDSGEDIVLSPFNEAKTINLVDGSIDAIMNLGSHDLNNSLDGGIDEVLQPTSI